MTEERNSTQEAAPGPGPRTSLPANAALGLKRERWNQFAVRLKNKDALTKAEWDTFIDLSEELQEKGSLDVDYWELIEASGAMDHVRTGVKTSRAAKLVRVEQVASWLEAGKSMDWMVSNCQRRWGVGYYALRNYRLAALTLIANRARHRQETYMGVALARINKLYDRGLTINDLGAVNNSICHLVRVMGLAAPTVQKMEVSGPDGGPMAFFDLPPKKIPDPKA